MGRCHLHLKQYEESYEQNAAAYAIYQSLTETKPQVLDYVIESARTEVKLGLWHLSQRNAADNKEASRWFDRATDRLTKLRDTGRAGSREWDIRKILGEIEANARYLSQPPREGPISPSTTSSDR